MAVLVALRFDRRRRRRAAPRLQRRRGPRIVAIGDVHGAFDQFVGILQAAGLIDAKRQWAGGPTVLVQTGDIFDRGAKVRDALDLLMRLEDEAKRAGGRVESLLGNHEVMNLLREFRDVSPAAYAAFADNRSEIAAAARIRRLRQAREAARGQGRAAARPRRVDGEPSAGLSRVRRRARSARQIRAMAAIAQGRHQRRRHRRSCTRASAPTCPGRSTTSTGTAAKDIAAWDDTKAAMVKAQIVPVFCTLPEAVEAAVAELQRISAALQASSPPGDHVTREFVEQLQALLAVGKSSLFEPEGPLWFRGFAHVAGQSGDGRHAGHAAPRASTASNDSSPGTRRSRDASAAFQQPHLPDRYRHADDVLQERAARRRSSS